MVNNNMISENDFLLAKNNALKKLDKAIINKRVDEAIIEILHLINSFDDFYTSSSCAGRIVILEIPRIGDKQNARFHGKWHRMVKLDEIKASVGRAKSGQLWFLSQSPIFHIGVRSLDSADWLLKKAILCGFKNSGLKSLGDKIIVEICSTERLDSPIGNDGILYYKDEYLIFLVDIANEVI